MDFMCHEKTGSGFQRNLSEAELQELILSHIGLVHQIASKFHAAGVDPDDWRQEGLIGLLDAIRSYEPEKRVSFRTYASVCIRNRLLKAVSAAQAKYNHALNEAVSLDDSLPTYQLENPEALFLEKESMAEISRQIKILLSSFERKTLSLYLQGFCYKDISRILGVSIKSVDNSLVRIRKKLKFLF